MPRRKKEQVSKEKRLSESYISLIVGFIVVFVGMAILLVLTKGNPYQKINTAISIFQEPSNLSQTEDKSKTYKVKEGDNLWTIAEKVYGSGYNWVDLVRANKIENPNVLFVGTQLSVPQAKKIVVEKTEQTLAQTKPITGSSYKVQEGDYLWEIAIRRYGDGYKWPEIARVNNIPNPDLIYTNSVLKLP